MDLKGIYDGSTQYAVGDVVKNENDNCWYVLQKPCNAGTSPVDTLYWNRASNVLATAAEMAMDAISVVGSKTETVSGDDPVIVAEENARYVCGEVDTISITPPAKGIVDVIFVSGSTPTVLTLPETVVMPEWFDATSLEADTVYEINILDGVYGVVTTWAD